jgi:cobalamin biosynthesis protein CobT
MAIIKIPVEIFKNGKTITHDDKCVIDYEAIDEIPEMTEQTAKFDLNELFSSGNDTIFKFKNMKEDDDDDDAADDDDAEDGDDAEDDDDEDDAEDDDDDEEDEEESIVNENPFTTLIKNQLFIQSGEMNKKKYRGKNSSFKNRKYTSKQFTKKIYPSSMEDSDPDDDLAQLPEGQE